MLRHRLPVVLALLVSALLIPALAAQSPASESPATPESPRIVDVDGRPALHGEYVVHFTQRGFDLSALRASNLSGVSAEVYAEQVRGVEARNRRERAGFEASVRELGGEVLEHFWIINASAIRIDPTLRAAVEALANVERVQPNFVYEPSLATATNASNHNSDAANQRTVNQQRVVGTGVTVAILDTGVDVQMGSANRPHRLYLGGGATNGRNRIKAALDVVRNSNGDDINGHGTFVSHCAGGASWSSSSNVDDGIAPDCEFVGINVAVSSSGSTSSTYLVRGWQRVLQDVRLYDIKVANNSYSGSPDPRDAAQQALDAAVYNGDVVATVPSGNNGGNISSTQAGYNGLNVGGTNNGSKLRASFSGTGTTNLGKEIPDLVAVGGNITGARRNTESSVTRLNGTSFSAPLVAGAAALARQVDPKLTALMTKALLINTVEISTYGNGRGAGYLRVDQVVDAAVQQDVYESKITTAQPKLVIPFTVLKSGRRSVTITWPRTNLSSSQNHDLDLRIYDASNTLLASSTRSAANSYERAEFLATSPGVYRAEIQATLIANSTAFAIAGAGQPIPPNPPTLSKISVSSYPVHGGGTVTLTGTNLDTVSIVHVGTQQVSPKSATATQLVFTPPVPSALGQVPVKVQNAGGSSGSLNFSYVAVSQPTLAVLTQLFTLLPVTDELWMGPGQVGLYYMSPSDQPSKLTGIVDLGIGNNFTLLIPFGVFVADGIGRGALPWTPPYGFSGLKFHVQAAVLDPKAPAFPLQSSQAVARTILL